MMLGFSSWQLDRIDFTVPDDCSAVLVRLRRVPSKRFDNQLAGKVWLDDFELFNLTED